MTEKGSKKKSSSKPKKRRSSKKVSGKGFKGWAITLVVLATLVAVAVLMLNTRAHHYSQDFAFEETNGNGLTALVVEVELAIYQSLRQLGVAPSQVQFRKVVHRSKKEKQWDYAELEVRLDRGQDMSKALELFRTNLASVGGNVSLRTPKKTATQLELTVRIETVLTHRLTLQLEQERVVVKPKPPSPAMVAIVIDDLGHDRRLAKRFLEIDGALSFSVLPYGTFSRSISRSINDSGRELLLHLPMEPKKYPEVNPGAGALLVGMSDSTLVQKLQENLDSLPEVVGVNNHMGSRFCENEEKMSVVLKELKSRHLFFLDSRTSGTTKGYRLAMQMGISSAERDVFLDNVQNPEAIRRQMKRLVQLAHLKGSAIGIAHPYKITLEVFRQDVPHLQERGVELVPISRVLHK